MNVKSVILVFAALLFAGGTAFVASRLMGTHKPAQQAQVQEQPGKKVLVAKGNLPSGTFIKEDDVSWQKWPVDGINDSYLVEGQADLSKVVGAVIRKGVVAGEPITEAKIARPGDRGFLAAVLTPGMRAISIEVNEPSSVAGLVFPGDRVDVLLNMEFVVVYMVDGKEETSQIKPKSSETVLENVRLLATDRNLNDIEGEPKKITTVTIEVTPKQAEMIKVAASMGQLALSLRGLGMPDGKAGGPTVASAQTAATSFFAQQAADTPGGPEENKPKSKSNADSAEGDPAPERGDTYTFDTEVSRPLEELRNPTGKKNGIQVVRGQPGQPQPNVQIVTPQ